MCLLWLYFVFEFHSVQLVNFICCFIFSILNIMIIVCTPPPPRTLSNELNMCTIHILMLWIDRRQEYHHCCLSISPKFVFGETVLCTYLVFSTSKVSFRSKVGLPGRTPIPTGPWHGKASRKWKLRSDSEHVDLGVGVILPPTSLRQQSALRP